MSIYTPVFPPRPPSSSPRPPNLISSLSKLHLSLASLPLELSPPEFLESEKGAHIHRLRIEAALRDAHHQPSNGDWSRLYSLVHMTCTTSKFRCSQATFPHLDVDDHIPWVLAETEEEWQEWETAWNQQKFKKNSAFTTRVVKQPTTGLQPKDAKPSPSKVQAIDEKVSCWKAQVEKAAGTPEINNVPYSTDFKRPSPLGFPVIKPSTSVTNKKSNATPKLPVVNYSKPRSNPEQRLPLPESSQSFMPPPSFLQVATSTPVKRNVKDTGIKESLPLFFASQISPERVKEYQPMLDTQTSPDHRPLFEPSQISPRKEDQPLFDPSTPDPIRVQPASSPSINTNKRLRPITPPFEDQPGEFLQTQAMFQTQTAVARHPKRSRTDPLTAPPIVASPFFNSKTPGKTSSLQGPPSPRRMSITPSRPVERSLGNAKGLFDVELNPAGLNTPEKRPPTLTELLASSQRSKPRPRPPSRKVPPTTPSKSKTPSRPQTLVDDPVVEKVTEHVEGQPDDAPATPKTYFSSPASSTSSSASAASSFNLRSTKPRFSPPASPLFTQHPESFNPPYTGTQIGEQRGGTIGEATLGRTGSLGMFGYNSQFDVDGHVDEVTAMLERDVDVDNWYKELQSQSQGPDVGV